MHFKEICCIAVILLLQVWHVKSDGDPKLESCVAKAFDQAKKYTWALPTTYPKCFQVTKLKKLSQDLSVFGDFADKHLQGCKKIDKDTLKKCLTQYFDGLNDERTSMRAGIVNAIHSLFEASRGCFTQISDQFNKLEDYVSQGCP